MNGKLKIFWLAAMLTFVGGCSLLPYDDEFSCGITPGYGKCLSATENYRLSQMSEQERTKWLCKKAAQVKDDKDLCAAYKEAQEPKEAPCDDKTANADFANADKSEIIGYLRRLTLDTEKARAEEKKLNEELERPIVVDQRLNEIGNNGESDENSGKFCVVDTEFAGKDEKKLEGLVAPDDCGYKNINYGDTIVVKVDRAWLREKPTADFPPTGGGLEARRGDRFVASSGKCGWVKLINERYIHQSIVEVIAK
jgi:hypothetical protein